MMLPKTLFSSLLLLLTQAALSQALGLRIVSWNIRYAASSLETNEKPWWTLLCFIWNDQCRQPHLISLLSSTAAAAPSGSAVVVGLQEVLSNQLSDIKSGLGSSWAHIGVGRDDGVSSGEFSPILYRTDVLSVVYSEVKWLSPTPDEVSYGWGAGSRRIVTIGVFQHISTGKRFIHANTHLDNVSSEARSKGILVVVDRIKAVQAIYGPLGVSLTGDFNSAPGGDAYVSLSNSGYMQGEMYNLAATRSGPDATYTGFSDEAASRIDFIWLGPASGYAYTAQTYQVLDSTDNGVRASDHRRVVGDVTLA
ncbi:endonuclease/Exonuclease/phosphatase [Thozetella sp. PMI_491]|nr:endonuclease/Exonuclease/phosphatase [Thozetella sp. PMI_491]